MMNKKKSPRLIQFVFFLSLFSVAQIGLAQSNYTRQDSLRGSITPERAWWDLKYYHLDVAIDPENRTIKGSVLVQYEVLETSTKLQIDLQEPLVIRSVLDENGTELSIQSEGNAHFISLVNPQRVGEINSIKIFYGGIPKVAVNPPWDGGISWDKDANGKDIIHSNCQGIGASIWWPNKDHMYDEPDSVLMSVTVPDDLMDVSNGRLRRVDVNGDGTKTWHWFVSNPISNYVLNINVADYEHFSEVYSGEKGSLDMDYYVFRGNVEIAKKQFKDAPRMMEAFEYWFGPYPFYEDGYKLVEVTSTGMEHQSSITYGNGFKNGYRGRDGSGTGHGFKFDFIIIHESGHEWFANNITYKDMGDMWVHESFTNYSESLFLEYHYTKEIGQEYVRGLRKLIQNDRPIIGPYEVNRSGSGDMYVKGGNLLNTLRTVIGNDEKWRNVLRGLNSTFYHQTVSTDQIENYISQEAEMDLTTFFNQYLRDYRVPILEYFFRKGQLSYRWANCVEGFNMPLNVELKGELVEITPTQGQWNSIETDARSVTIDPNFYIGLLRTY
jgi:aminopeptidase N